MPKKSEFIKLMEKGEVDDSYNMRGDNVASPRSRKAGQKAMDKTTQELHTLVENLEKLMGENVQLEVEPNVSTINIKPNKENKKKLN